MKLNKKTFYKIHQWAGIKLSILFFIVCFSGTLATLSVEFDWIFLPAIRAEKRGNKVDLNQKVDNLAKYYPEANIRSWYSQKESYVCDIVYLEEKGQRYYAFVNPYTGLAQGRANITIQRFLRDLHYYLFIPNQVGHFIVLFFGFLLFTSLISALIFFNKWFKHLFPIKLKTKNKEVMFRSLHRLLGAWTIPFIFIISLTAIWYFMERTNMWGISTEANPKSPVINNEIPSDYNTDDFYFKTIDFNKAVAIAKDAIPNLEVKDVHIPEDPNYPIYINGVSNVPLVRNRANRVYINPLNYEIVMIREANKLSPITFINDVADPFHFGYWGGLITKILWFFGGLSISTLILTGIWVALRRNAKKKMFKKQKESVLGKWINVNYAIILTVIGYMYYTLINRYSVPSAVIYIVTFIIIVLFILGWYVFIYLVNKPVKNTKGKK